MKAYLLTVGLLWQAVVAGGVLLAIGHLAGVGWEIAAIPVLVAYAIGSMVILARMP